MQLHAVNMQKKKADAVQPSFCLCGLESGQETANQLSRRLGRL